MCAVMVTVNRTLQIKAPSGMQNLTPLTWRRGLFVLRHERIPERRHYDLLWFFIYHLVGHHYQWRIQGGLQGRIFALG